MHRRQLTGAVIGAIVMGVLFPTVACSKQTAIGSSEELIGSSRQGGRIRVFINHCGTRPFRVVFASISTPSSTVRAIADGGAVALSSDVLLYGSIKKRGAAEAIDEISPGALAHTHGSLAPVERVLDQHPSTLLVIVSTRSNAGRSTLSWVTTVPKADETYPHIRFHRFPGRGKSFVVKPDARGLRQQMCT